MKSTKDILKKLDRMSYLELVKVEDKILLDYESLSFNRENSFSSVWRQRIDTEQVKWLSGRIVLFSLSSLCWGALYLLIFHVFKSSLPKIMTQSMFALIPLIGSLLLAVIIANFIWHKLMTPFSRTIIRGLIHYWPATLLGITLLVKNLKS